MYRIYTTVVRCWCRQTLNTRALSFYDYVFPLVSTFLFIAWHRNASFLCCMFTEQWCRLSYSRADCMSTWALFCCCCFGVVFSFVLGLFWLVGFVVVLFLFVCLFVFVFVLYPGFGLFIHHHYHQCLTPVQQWNSVTQTSSISVKYYCLALSSL